MRPIAISAIKEHVAQLNDVLNDLGAGVQVAIVEEVTASGYGSIRETGIARELLIKPNCAEPLHFPNRNNR